MARTEATTWVRRRFTVEQQDWVVALVADLEHGHDSAVEFSDLDVPFRTRAADVATGRRTLVEQREQRERPSGQRMADLDGSEQGSGGVHDPWVRGGRDNCSLASSNGELDRDGSSLTRSACANLLVMSLADGSERSQLERSIRNTTIAAVVFVLLALLGLPALAEPRNIGAFIFVEVISVVPLVFVLRRRTRARRHLAELPEPTRTEVPANVIQEPAPTLTFDAAAPAQLVLRVRRPLILLGLVGPPALLLGLLVLEYEAAEFDPRLVLLVPTVVITAMAALRSRLLVADGSLWRQGPVGRAGVRLDSLAAVEVRRARFFKNEGYLRTILRVADRDGRQIQLKPALWTHRARPLLAGLGALARQQQIVLDDRTTAAVSEASERWGHEALWAQVVPKAGPDDDAPVQRRPMRSTFWTRRDEFGHPAKLQLQRLVVLALLFGVGLPVMLVIRNVGTDSVRSLRCRNERSMWAHPDAYGDGHGAPFAIAQSVSSTDVGQGRIYRIGPEDISNEYNTEDVRRDAERLVGGYVIQWVTPAGAGDDLRAEVYIEQFVAALDATAFQRDWSEDHCHEGERAFSDSAVPGGVGFRHEYGRNSDDRLAFVRGDMRVQVVAWSVLTRAGHEEAVDLAKAALASIQAASSFSVPLG